MRNETTSKLMKRGAEPLADDVNGGKKEQEQVICSILKQETKVIATWSMARLFCFHWRCSLVLGFCFCADVLSYRIHK